MGARLTHAESGARTMKLLREARRGADSAELAAMFDITENYARVICRNAGIHLARRHYTPVAEQPAIGPQAADEGFRRGMTAASIALIRAMLADGLRHGHTVWLDKATFLTRCREHGLVPQ